MTPTIDSAQAGCFELRFRSLYREGTALAFPCDRTGNVTIDDLSARAKNNYLYARAVVGREYATPQVVPASP